MPELAEEWFQEILDYDREYRQPGGDGYWEKKGENWITEGTLGYAVEARTEGVYLIFDPNYVT